MTQPRLASPHTSCWLNHWSTSVSFPLHHLQPTSTLPSCLLLPPPSLYFNDCRFTRWLKKPGAAKKCANSRQCGRDKQKRARAAKKAPTALHCVLPHTLICSSFHVISRPPARTWPQQRWERSGWEKRGKKARERWNKRYTAAGDRVGAAGKEKKRAKEKTWWLSLSSKVKYHIDITKYLSWLTWKFNTTTHYCYINPSFSALCAKPVPFLSFSFSSLSFYLSLHAFFLVSLRTNLSVTPLLKVSGIQRSTRLRLNWLPCKERREQTVLPEKSFWGQVFTLMITKPQSELTKITEQTFQLLKGCQNFCLCMQCFFSSPPSQAQQSSKESMEYTPEERDYSLLPAPIHVGEYMWR